MNKKYFFLFCLLVCWGYIVFRLTATFSYHPGFLIASLLILIAEVRYIISLTLITFLKLKIPYQETRDPAPLPTEDRLPTVDVMILTYNEPLHILKATIMAAKSLEYPAEKLKIWLCDDGNRAEFAQFSQEAGIQYLTRESRKGAKAGNMNHALTHLKGELILSLDADFIVMPSLLKETVGFFTEPKMGFVQLPQYFYDYDIFQHNLFLGNRIPNDNNLFMRVIQPLRNLKNSTVCCGTPTLYRRKAIDTVGGFVEDSVTEDFPTGMLIQGQGYQSLFYNKVLAGGLSAQSATDWLLQRTRWTLGNLQALKNHPFWNIPLFSFFQKAFYFLSSLELYTFCSRIALGLISPILILFGFSIFFTQYNKALMSIALLSFLSMIVLQKWIYQGERSSLWDNVQDTLLSLPMLIILVWTKLTKQSNTFIVTPKGITQKRYFFHRRLAYPLLFIFGIQLIAFLKGIYLLTQESDLFTKELILGNLGWIFFYAWSTLVAIMVCFEPPRIRENELKHNPYYDVEIFTGSSQPTHSFLADSNMESCLLVLKEKLHVNRVKIVIHGKIKHEFDAVITEYYQQQPDFFFADLQFMNTSLEAYSAWLKDLHDYSEIEQKECRIKGSWLAEWFWAPYQFIHNFGFIFVVNKEKLPIIQRKLKEMRG